MSAANVSPIPTRKPAGEQAPDFTCEPAFPALRAFLQWPSGSPLRTPPATPGEPQGLSPSGPPPAPRAKAPQLPPTIRPSVRRPRPTASQQADLALSSVASAALYSQPNQNLQQFDIAMDIAPIGPIRCQIALGADGIDATFVVADIQQRWLLAGQLAHLRAHLAERGLTANVVRVVQEDDPTAPPVGGVIPKPRSDKP